MKPLLSFLFAADPTTPLPTLGLIPSHTSYHLGHFILFLVETQCHVAAVGIGTHSHRGSPAGEK